LSVLLFGGVLVFLWLPELLHYLERRSYVSEGLREPDLDLLKERPQPQNLWPIK
jgi:hypothetical protein